MIGELNLRFDHDGKLPSRAPTVKVVISAGLTWQGKRLLPDVDEAVADKASWITPRLGGVGVTTVAMLLLDAVKLAEASVELSPPAGRSPPWGA